MIDIIQTLPRSERLNNFFLKAIKMLVSDLTLINFSCIFSIWKIICMFIFLIITVTGIIFYPPM